MLGILSNKIQWYINLTKFKVLLYNLKCGLCDWRDFNLVPLENHQILILAKISTHMLAQFESTCKFQKAMEELTCYMH